MSLKGLIALCMYAIVALVLAYFAFDLWRPSILLVGNVTIDLIGSGAKQKQRPGGALRKSTLLHHALADRSTNPVAIYVHYLAVLSAHERPCCAALVHAHCSKVR